MTTANAALSGLYSVPWQRLTHAHGAATDVPELITNLAQPDQKLRDESWHELYGNLWHQGTVYEATVYAVPFFIRLLEVESLPQKHRILLYLADLFCGRSYLDVHMSISNTEVSKPDFRPRLEAELANVNATKTAVRAGLETYVRQLHRPEAEPKIAAAYLLGLIGDRADDGQRDLSIEEEIAKCCEELTPNGSGSRPSVGR